MKKIYFILCMLFIATPILAQHEFSFGAGFGSTNLRFDKSIARFGGNFGFGYTYNFSERFGLRTGLDLALFNAKFEGNGYGGWMPTPPWDIPEGHFVIYNVFGKGIKENINATYLQIPIMAQFSQDRRQAWYFATGLKFSIPISGKWNSTVETITANAQNTYTQNIYKNMPELGFTTFYNLSGNGNFDLKFRTFFALETGMRWTLPNNLKLYTGIYIDHVFTGFRDAILRLGPLAKYNAENPPIILESVYLGNSINLGGTAIGVTARISLTR